MPESLSKAAIGTAGALVVLLHLAPALARTTRVIAASGDPIPGTNDYFAGADRRYLFSAQLNDQGQVSFSAPIANSTGRYALGIFQADASTLIEIARSDGLAPDGTSQYGSLARRGQNDSGQVLFVADFRSENGQFTGDTGLYLWDDGDASIVEIARRGQTLPDGSGVIADWGIDWAALNNTGRVSMLVELWETSGGASDNRVIFLHDGDDLIEIVREGHAAPNASTFSFIGSPTLYQPALNNHNQVAFSGRLIGMTENALFRSDGVTITELTRYGQSAPGGGGTLGRFHDFAFNDEGEAAYTTRVNDPNNPTLSRSTLIRADGDESVEIAREGDSVPDGNGSFKNLFIRSSQILNNAGQVFFEASLSNTNGGYSDDFGLFRGDGIHLTQIVRGAQATPDGNGSFDNFYTSPGGMNDRGQVAFSASLTGTTGGASDDAGIFLWDDAVGLLQVSREGDSLLGSTIIGLDLNTLNDGGQIAFAFRLANGRGGIAVWAIPEPSAIALIVASLLGLRIFVRR